MTMKRAAVRTKIADITAELSAGQLKLVSGGMLDLGGGVLGGTLRGSLWSGTKLATLSSSGVMDVAYD